MHRAFGPGRDPSAELRIFVSEQDRLSRVGPFSFGSFLGFSTVRNADRIIVIEDGRVVEAGSHEELVACANRYASMFGAQAAGYR
jgi:hypothetical protein